MRTLLPAHAQSSRNLPQLFQGVGGGGGCGFEHLHRDLGRQLEQFLRLRVADGELLPHEIGLQAPNFRQCAGTSDGQGGIERRFRVLGRRRHEARPDQTMRQKIGDPGGVVHVALAAGHVADVRRVRQKQNEAPLENVYRHRG
jgi:hypothetical protein